MIAETIFRIILGVLFIIMYLPRRYFESLSRNTSKEALLIDRDTKVSILLQTLLFTISTVSIIVFVINPPWMAWSTLSLLNWLGWIGVGAAVVGTALLISTHLTLGKKFFGGMKLRSDHELIVDGPYRWGRHPMCTAFIMLGIGYFLPSASWLIGISWLLGVLLVLTSRMPQEEVMMLNQFGEAYRTSMSRTVRFLPRVTRNEG